MLALILADGNIVCLIQQDIRRHEAGIGEQSAVYIVGVLCALILKLRHAAELAEHGVAIEYPAKLCMLVNMALQEQNVLFRVYAAGNVLGKLLEAAAAQQLRILAHGERVQIGHEIIAVKFICSCAPVLHGSQIIAEVKIARGLNARQHAFLFYLFHLSYLLFDLILI